MSVLVSLRHHERADVGHRRTAILGAHQSARNQITRHHRVGGTIQISHRHALKAEAARAAAGGWTSQQGRQGVTTMVNNSCC